MSKPARPPPPLHLKKVLPRVPTAVDGNAPTPSPKPSVKPKPKLQTSPKQVNKKPPMNRSLSSDLLGNSTERSAVDKKKLVSVVSNDVKAEIARQLESPSFKHRPAGSKSPTGAVEQGNRSITKSPVLPVKPISRQMSPRNTQVTAIDDAKPMKKVIQQLSGVSTGPSVILMNDTDSTPQDVYEAPDVDSIQMNSFSSLDHGDRPRVLNGIHNATYEAPVLIHPTTNTGTTKSNHDEKVFTDSSDAYAYLSDTFETPNTNCTSPDGGSGCGKYEVPIKTIDTTINDDDTYETPDIESVRMIQAELKNQGSDHGEVKDKRSSNTSLPSPPGVLPPKLQQRAGKFKNKKLPAIPTVSLDKSKKDNSKSSKEDGSGYTKVKNNPSSTQSVGGMIYEEVKPKNIPPLVKKERSSSNPPANTCPSSAPPLPPPRKPHPPQQSSPGIIKVSSQPDVSLTSGGGLELTEDDEGEDYMDMSGDSSNHDDKNKPQINVPTITTQQPVEESDGLYETMDVSRPIPPPRRKHRHTEIRPGNTKGQSRNKLKACKSLDGLLLSEDDHYVTMHRPTAPAIK